MIQGFNSLRDCDCDVVDGQPALEEEVLAHVRQRRRRVDGVAPHAVTLQIGRGVAALLEGKVNSKLANRENGRGRRFALPWR